MQFPQLNLEASELVAVLAVALEDKNFELVKALEFCAIAGVGLLDLDRFTPTNYRHYRTGSHLCSVLVKSVLDESVDARIKLSEIYRGPREKHRIFSPSAELFPAFEVIREALQIPEPLIPEAEIAEIQDIVLKKFYKKTPATSTVKCSKTLRQKAISDKHSLSFDFTESCLTFAQSLLSTIYPLGRC